MDVLNQKQEPQVDPMVPGTPGLQRYGVRTGWESTTKMSCHAGMGVCWGGFFGGPRKPQLPQRAEEGQRLNAVGKGD